MGVMLDDRGIAQVSMNLTNYQKTPIFRVFEMVKREAERYGVSILESEIVGLVPSAALVVAAEYYLQLERFSGDQVLENKLRSSSKPRSQARLAPTAPVRSLLPRACAGTMPKARILR